MKNSPLFITAREWFESTALKNPVRCLDHKLLQFHPDCYDVSYDTKLLVTKNISAQASYPSPFHSLYAQFGSTDIRVLDTAITDCDAKYVFLNGFNQEQFLHVVPKLRDTAEIIYFFKCPKIHDLSALAHFSKLRCVHIYWNNSLEALWDMTDNKQLKILSFITVSKLAKIDTLEHSQVEYIRFDSSDNNGNKKKALFDVSVFKQMPQLKHLLLIYSDCKIDY